ncbi:hypothetical protein GCM10027589_09390 [Actinocorallia lasiicapitis]
MAPFPARSTHWHISTPRKAAAEADRLTREQALLVLRQWVIAEHRQTRDPRCLTELAALDAGWSSARIASGRYVAFACACPSSPETRRAT